MSGQEDDDDDRVRPSALDAEAELMRLEPVARGDELVRRQAVELALGALAKAFVTSEEVNDRFLEAKAALEGLEVEGLPDVVRALSAAGTPFALRPLGMRGFDDARVRENLSEFLRLALSPAARIRTAVQEEFLPDRGSTATPGGVAIGGDAAQQDVFRDMIETAERYEQSAIFREAPERLVAPEVFDDELPAHGDRELAGSMISSILSRARVEFNVLVNWPGSRAPARVAKDFRDALDAAEACLLEISSAPIPATFIASDVHNGVVAAFQLASADQKKVSGSANAADILARIVLELAGLIAAQDHDDAKRAEYTRRMRNRAAQEASSRHGLT